MKCKRKGCKVKFDKGGKKVYCSNYCRLKAWRIAQKLLKGLAKDIRENQAKQI